MKQSNLRVRNFTKAVHSKLIFNHFIYINCHYKYATDEIINRKKVLNMKKRKNNTPVNLWPKSLIVIKKPTLLCLKLFRC